ncbi:MAG: hypothetical protein A2W27_11365 [Deltaproteobacteria bacterium RBG_16_44_11]|nr:MAG: hypothetical protein A2W27_11365 [Deltaproteobacteria bacterium RBG_16_44_11]
MKEESQKIAVTPAQNITPYYSLPWIFQHQEILSSTTTERPWDQKKLVNKLNHLNFIDSYVFILCRHQQTGKHVLIKAYPQPCVKEELICRLDPKDKLPDMTEYNLDYLMIDDGLTAILSPVRLLSREGNLLKLTLPDKSQVLKTRKTRRHYCHDISCELIQDGFNAQGMLIDFTPSALGIKLSVNSNINKFDENNPVEINLTQNGVKLYSGPCRLIRNGINSPDGKIVFRPLNKQMALFPKRNVRSSRERIAPSLTINFIHPIFQKNIIREIFDVSTSGLSLRDTIEEEILIPGLIIPNLSIIYAGIIKMDCSAQVVYNQEDQKINRVQCGLAIADMDIKSCTRLNHILGIYTDGYVNFSTAVAIDELWEFFFDTGFIYGEKYEHLYSYRQNFKETYKKLYQDNPDIARHFIYENNGRIYGHIAMVHAYKPSWLIHHFSARRMGNRLPGNSVLKQINQFIRSYNRLPSAEMSHVMTYYRPENRVVDRIFGRFTRNLNDLKKSSLDTFSYFLFKKIISKELLPNDWQLKDCTFTDLNKLSEFYKSSSGGLLTRALGLEYPSDSIKKSFADAGFKRDYRTYCLYYKEKQVAFFVVNQSDMGLNLSDLLNCFKIIVMDKNILSWDILLNTVNILSSFFTEEKIPLLIFPSDYLHSQHMQEEKLYTLWILDTYNAVEEYLSYMDNLLKFNNGK